MSRSPGNKTVILGLMSGTSLDGLDMALCEFDRHQSFYGYKILKAETVPYSTDQKRKLSEIKNASAKQYFAMDHLYGKFIAGEVLRFLKDSPILPEAIASHGHTVFHQPQAGFTTQIGNGATMAARTGLTTICDFRSLDVANGGQGAPLVPIGDKLLFGEHDACLNLGGIANISFEENGIRKAFDICFLNMALNFMAEKLGKDYDENGDMAASGAVDPTMLEELRVALKKEEGISLSREIFEAQLLPVLYRSNAPINHKLTTLCEYMAEEIVAVLHSKNITNVLLSGGGAFNTYLVHQMKNKFKGKLVIPEKDIIQFKEALIFAFLGYLRLHGKTNTLKEVTGAISDSVGGAVYLAPVI